jgi:translation initiation factor 2-alpha kinase 4
LNGADNFSFDIVSPLRSAAAEVEMIEVVDKVISEFRGGKMASEEALYEFHVNHESGESSPPSSSMGLHTKRIEQADAQSCLLF